MKVKKIAYLTILAAATPLVGNRALALPTVLLYDLPGVNPGGGGGEFTAVTSTGVLNPYGPANLANANNTGATGFETFCAETGVEFTPANWGGGGPYYYTVGQVAEPSAGGPQSSGAGQPLTQGAAWLYYQFATGELGKNYGFVYGGAASAAGATSDDELQAAFWFFQGHQTYGSYTPPGDPFYTDAITALGGVGGTALDPNQDPSTGSLAFPVGIMQLWDANGNAAQNQLIMVPDGGMTATLLGVGLLGVQALRRKLEFNQTGIIFPGR
jgi:hypothetical protein